MTDPYYQTPPVIEPEPARNIDEAERLTSEVVDGLNFISTPAWVFRNLAEVLLWLRAERDRREQP